MSIKKIIGEMISLPVWLACKAHVIGFKQACAIVSGIPYGVGSVTRASILRRCAGSCGKDVAILDGSSFWFTDPGLLHIGNNTRIERDVLIGEVMACSHEVRIGRKCVIRDHARIGAYGGPVTIGDNCGVGFGCVLRGPIKMGSGSGIAQYTSIMGVTHIYQDVEDSYRNKNVITKTVEIGDNVWIGGNCMLVAGVRIGRNTVIGANSVVTGDIPPYCVAAGCPARVIKRYDFEKKEWVRANDKGPQT